MPHLGFDTFVTVRPWASSGKRRVPGRPLLQRQLVPVGFTASSRVHNEHENPRHTISDVRGQGRGSHELYAPIFPDSSVISIRRYGPGRLQEGTAMWRGLFIAGQSVMCIDSPMKHDFTFTPAMSLFVDCAMDAQLEDLFAKLSAGGQVLDAASANGPDSAGSLPGCPIASEYPGS